MTNLFWRLATATMTGVAFTSILLDGVSGHNVPTTISGLVGIGLAIIIGAIFVSDWREAQDLKAKLRAKVRDLPDSH